jgi:hypothetical protein
VDPGLTAATEMRPSSRPENAVLGGIQLATMRQIAEELRFTLMMAGAKNRGDLPNIEFKMNVSDGKGWKSFRTFEER